MMHSLPKLLICGGHGQLANALQQELQHNPPIVCSRADLDITVIENIEQVIAQHHPDIIINCAAYTAVDKAEQEKELALNTNYIGAKNLARLCNQYQLPLIQVSTDYIFKGDKTTPYLESDEAQPINIYGESKYLGEQAIREIHSQHIILRVSAIFSEYGANFFKTILHLAKERSELRIVADQITSPTYAGNIAKTIHAICHKLSHWGTYHYCDQAPTSWFEFAEFILMNHPEFKTKQIHPITSADYPTAAKRPAYSVLDCKKLADDYGIMQQSWKVAVKNLLTTLGNS